MTEENFDVDALLDATLDDLEDLPEFTPFPPGVHRVAVTLDLKEINGNKCATMDIKGIETMELVDPANTAAIKEGDSTNVMFMLNNEYGQGNLKKLCLPIGEALGTGVIRDVIEQTNDLECIIISSLRQDKNDKEKYHMNVKELNVI